MLDTSCDPNSDRALSNVIVTEATKVSVPHIKMVDRCCLMVEESDYITDEGETEAARWWR